MLGFQVHCKDCIFAVCENGIQKSCSLNKASEEHEMVDGFFTFNHLCRFHRDQEWIDKNNIEHPVEAVMLEARPRIGLAINFIGNYDLPRLKNTINSMPEARYIIVVNDKPEYNDEIFDILQSETNLDQSKLHIVQIIDQVPEYYIDEAFKFARKGWFCYIPCGYEFPKTFVDTIDNFTNNTRKTLSVCHNDKCIIFYSSLFATLGGNKPRIDKDGQMDRRSFIERVESYPNSDKCIYNWEIFFNV